VHLLNLWPDSLAVERRRPHSSSRVHIDVAYDLLPSAGSAKDRCSCTRDLRRPDRRCRLSRQRIHLHFPATSFSSSDISLPSAPHSALSSSSCPLWGCKFNCGQTYSHSSRRSIGRHLLSCFRLHRPALKNISDIQVQAFLSGVRKPSLVTNRFAPRQARGTEGGRGHASSRGHHRTSQDHRASVTGSVHGSRDHDVRRSVEQPQDHIDVTTSSIELRSRRLTGEDARLLATAQQSELRGDIDRCTATISNDAPALPEHIQTPSSFHVGNSSPGDITSLWHALNDDQRDLNWSLRHSLQAITWIRPIGQNPIDPTMSLPQMVRFLLLGRQTAVAQ
jgi:hypothetical protein